MPGQVGRAAKDDVTEDLRRSRARVDWTLIGKNGLRYLRSIGRTLAAPPTATLSVDAAKSRPLKFPFSTSFTHVLLGSLA